MQSAASMLQQGERREWMGLLARAPQALLEQWADGQRVRRFSWLRRPETGLMMVRARAGATGAQFNLGEMTVTRCVLKLEGGHVGVAYVQGRSSRKAEIVALADALLQSPEAADVRRDLMEAVRLWLDADAARREREGQATKVEFFTLARESTG